MTAALHSVMITDDIDQAAAAGLTPNAVLLVIGEPELRTPLDDMSLPYTLGNTCSHVRDIPRAFEIIQAYLNPRDSNYAPGDRTFVILSVASQKVTCVRP